MFHRNMSCFQTELAAVGGKLWNNLSERKMKKYTALAKKEDDVFLQKLEAFM